jgi:hypothetical protein
MARIRTIKPDFWTDEALTECSLSARLLFIGSWNFADDNGNMNYSAKQLKMKIFPADDIDCQPLINELIAHGLLREYSVNDCKYLNIKGFSNHQVINRPTKSSIPVFQFNDDSRSAHGGLSTEGKGTEGNGVEGKTHTQIQVGLIVPALTKIGLMPFNPTLPDFIKLIEAGATVDEFVSFGEEGHSKIQYWIFTYHDD